jgi:hypothetical protein
MRSNIIVNLTAGERVFVKIAPSFTQAAQTSNRAKINDEGTCEPCPELKTTTSGASLRRAKDKCPKTELNRRPRHDLASTSDALYQLSYQGC